MVGRTLSIRYLPITNRAGPSSDHSPLTTKIAGYFFWSFSYSKAIYSINLNSSYYNCLILYFFSLDRPPPIEAQKGEPPKNDATVSIRAPEYPSSTRR